MSVEIFSAIADQVGCSPQTVQRVLNRPLRDKRPTIVKRTERIRGLAAEMNYRPNAAAKSLVTGRFNCVALVLSESCDVSFLPPGMLERLAIALARRDLHLTIACLSERDLTSEPTMPRLLKESMSDGLLIDYTDNIPPALSELVDRYRIASIWYNAQRAHDCVCPDDFGARREAAERLIALGHRRIAYMDVHGAHRRERPEFHFSVPARRDGYVHAMRAAGLEPDVVETNPPGRSPASETMALWRAIFRRPARPTAVMAYASDALVPVFAAATACRLRVPCDLSLLSFCSPCVEWGDFGLSVMAHDTEALADAAAQAIVARIARPERSLKPVNVPFRYVPLEKPSVGPAP